MGLLFVGLMGFGATGLSGTVRTVGDVGEKPITTQAYFNELQRVMRIRQDQIGRAVSFPEAEAEGLPQRALATVVSRRALDNEVSQLGISVGNDVVSEQVMSNPAFRGGQGTFDRSVYRDTLARNGLSVREFETSLREEAARALLQGAVFTGIPDATTFGAAFAQYLREGRSFTWAPLTADTIEVVLPEPSDADLMAHYEANPALYTSLETRVIRYAWLTPDMLQDDVPVDEDELRAEYEARLEDFVQPERRLVERLVFPDDASAQAAMAAIDAAQTTFPELVAERGLSLDDVDIGDVTQTGLGEAGAAVFALENGGVAGPFPSEFGPALFRMNAVLAARNITFEQAQADLREDQAAARAARLIDDQVDGMIDLLAGGASIDDLVAQTEMRAGSIDWTPEVSDGIATYASFRDVAAATDVADFPELFELDDGGVFALDVLSVNPPALIALEEVRDEVIAGWEAEQTAAAVIAEAEALAAQITPETDMTTLGLEAIAEEAITRRGFINGAPSNFLSEVFEMASGDVRILPNGEGAVIVRLDAVAAADTSDEAYTAELETLAETAAQGMAQDVYEIFTGQVQLRTDVRINDQAINAVHANFR